MNPTDTLLNVRDVRRRFDRASAGFDDADFVHALTRDSLLARLEPVTVDASHVLDLGAATGSAGKALAKRFPKARITHVDLSAGMLKAARAKQGWFRKAGLVQADARALPFADHSVDVVFANLLLPWIDDPGALFRELARVLRQDGLLAFSTLGPDTLGHLRAAWGAVDDALHLHHFIDMHDVGDELIRAGFSDPVLDVDRMEVSYRDSDTLFRDLTAVGARNSLKDRRRSLTGRGRFDAFRRVLETELPMTLALELVYGHSWGRGQRIASGEFRVGAERIPVRRA